MTVLDWVLLLVVGASALLGVWRGLIAMAVSLAAWLLAGLAAYLFGGDIGRSLAGDGPAGWGEYLGGYALGFGAVWIMVTMLGLLLRRLAHSAGLSGTDRFLGLGLGVVRGVFLACVLVLLLGMTSVPHGPAWRDSTAVPMLVPAAKWLRDRMPRVLAQGVDLEGRGSSLQEAVQSTPGLGRALDLPRPVPAAPSRLPAPIPTPRMPPQTASQSSPTTVAPGQEPGGKGH